MKEIYKNPKLTDGFSVSVFKEFHGMNPYDAHNARAIVEANFMIISHFYELGEVDDDQLEVMSESSIVRQTFLKMMDFLVNEDYKKFEEIHNEIYNNIPLFCGWLGFYNEYLEEKFKLNLIPRGKEDKYQEFLRHNEYMPSSDE